MADVSEEAILRNSIGDMNQVGFLSLISQSELSNFQEAVGTLQRGMS